MKPLRPSLGNSAREGGRSVRATSAITGRIDTTLLRQIAFRITIREGLSIADQSGVAAGLSGQDRENDFEAA